MAASTPPSIPSAQTPRPPDGPALAPAERIADGVFFALPDALPRGRHNLSRETVRAAQRERLLAAVTELLAIHGYQGFGPGDVAKRAGVSLAAFYDCFTDKDGCVFAGYDRFIEVLLSRLTATTVDGLDRPAIVDALLSAYLDTLQSDLVVARAYQVEIDALGPAARERRRISLRLFAEYIQAVTQSTASGDDEASHLPTAAFIGVVYAARQLASDALDEQPRPDLDDLRRDLRRWLADVFRQR